MVAGLKFNEEKKNHCYGQRIINIFILMFLNEHYEGTLFYTFNVETKVQL